MKHRFRIPIIHSALVCCIGCWSLAAEAERYRTWVDEQGEVRISVIEPDASAASAEPPAEPQTPVAAKPEDSEQEPPQPTSPEASAVDNESTHDDAPVGDAVSAAAPEKTPSPERVPTDVAAEPAASISPKSEPMPEPEQEAVTEIAPDSIEIPTLEAAPALEQVVESRVIEYRQRYRVTPGGNVELAPEHAEPEPPTTPQKENLSQKRAPTVPAAPTAPIATSPQPDAGVETLREVRAREVYRAGGDGVPQKLSVDEVFVKQQAPGDEPPLLGRPTADFLAEGESLEDYIPAEELEKRGYRRPDSRPFFTWTDGQGQIRSRYIQDSELNLEDDERKPGVQYTHGQQLFAEDASTPELPEHADATALAILQLDEPRKTEMEVFASGCCYQVPVGDFKELRLKRSSFFVIDRLTDHKIDFPTGESFYKGVRIPDSLGPKHKNKTMAVRVRSYIRDGVFYPTVVFLDGRGRPLRMVKHAVNRYQPENWHRYGYIEGVLRVRPEDGEKYVLVFTTRGDVGLSGTYIGDKETLDVTHRSTGEIEVSLLLDSSA